MRERRGPQFIGVGPEKTGSTWLFRNLRTHPDVFLPPHKEIRYFYERSVYPDLEWYSRFSKKNWFTRETRRYLMQRVQSLARRPHHVLQDPVRLKWDVRYLFSERSDRWYLSLFDNAVDQVSGEISPQYFFMPAESINHMQRLLPDLKVIIFLRDPIEWTWSFARMSLLKGRQLEEVNESELMAFFDAKMKRSFSDTIDLWQSAFGENVYVDFYDRLNEEPRALYTDICKFLSIDIDHTPSGVWEQLSRTVNKGKKISLSEHHLRYLAEGWHDEIERLCERYAVYPQRWRDEYKPIFSNATAK